MNTHPLEKFRFCPACGSAHWIVNNFKSKHCTGCGFTYYSNAQAAVAAFIQNEQGDLLVCRRAHDPAKGTLDLPGGFVDMEETAEEAICREIVEELGIEVSNLTYRCSLPNVYKYSGMALHTLDILYQCQVKNTVKPIAADDVSEVFFMPLNTISPDDFGLNSIKMGIIAFLKENT
jgi:mutator protein MutT